VILIEVVTVPLNCVEIGNITSHTAIVYDDVKVFDFLYGNVHFLQVKSWNTMIFS